MTTRPIPFWLILSTALTVMAGVGSLVFVLFLPMMFDAPGSEDNPLTVLLAWSVGLFPLFCLASVVLSWWAFNRGSNRRAFLMVLLPGLPLLVAVLAVVALSIFNGGRFGT